MMEKKQTKMYKRKYMRFGGSFVALEVPGGMVTSILLAVVKVGLLHLKTLILDRKPPPS